jgi:hypothetical protein
MEGRPEWGFIERSHRFCEILEWWSLFSEPPKFDHGKAQTGKRSWGKPALGQGNFSRAWKTWTPNTTDLRAVVLEDYSDCV